MDKASILEVSSGAILERVNYEMVKVVQNIMDPNTKSTAKRRISVTLTLTPSADRSTVTVDTTAKTTLAPTEPITTSICIYTDPRTGELLVAEMVPQIPGQQNLYSGEQAQPKIITLGSAANG